MTCAKRNTRTQGEQIRRITALLTYVVSGIAILVGLVMQCWCVAQRGVWFDESFTIRMVGFPGSEMLTRISLDHTPPLHYVLLKGWMAVAGTSLYAFRMPSLFSGLAIVVGAYCLTGRLYRDYSARREGALLSAALCSLLPLLIDASTECRMYSLMAALSVLSAYALVRAIDESSSLWWAAYGLRC